MYDMKNSRIANPHAIMQNSCMPNFISRSFDTYIRKIQRFFKPLVPDASGDSNSFLSHLGFFNLLYSNQFSFYLSRLGTSKYFAYIVVRRKAIAKHDRLKNKK